MKEHSKMGEPRGGITGEPYGLRGDRSRRLRLCPHPRPRRLRSALAGQGAAALNVDGVGLCLPESDTCTWLSVGVAAYTGNERQDTPAPLTYSSADGRLQVYGRGESRINSLLILDSPPVTPANREMRSVSRVYTLVGQWSGSLQVQIQAECCVDADDENTPSLLRYADGEWSESGRPPFSPQESYILATIDRPGSYALFR